jgi:hypothetical protein
MELYALEYSDGECSHFLGVYSTPEKAEIMKKYWEEADRTVEVYPLEVDNMMPPRFARTIVFDDSCLKWFGLSEKEKKDHDIMNWIDMTGTPKVSIRTTSYHGLFYTTPTLDLKAAMLEALEAYIKISIEDGWKEYSYTEQDSINSWMSDLSL